MQIPEGTLVRVLREELEQEGDEDIVDNHGYLWIIVSRYPNTSSNEPRWREAYYARSLATGKKETFRRAELETYDAET